ncbi:hypothetical protein OIU85_001157 [Salix viminalis]|uniref:CCT domain-containing protein n=1 Tax=Salix viminalis TaxID=40686 RepID=A0A9Q0VLF6_SALVM|nr:hypothetical protein OIU85_001157 [Salix viminalis]
MYGNSTFIGNNSSGVISRRPSAADQLVIPDPAAAAGFETVGSHCTSSTASGCSSYGSPSSLVSGSCSVIMQRSISSHSFQKNGYHCHFTSHPHDFLDMETSPVRRVFSTGDLQHGHRAESPLLSESCMIIESMNKACKYSPEEKKERIESLYCTALLQCGFSSHGRALCQIQLDPGNTIRKKMQQKILADSRPRIRGRFARNDEIEKNPQLQWSNVSGEEDEEDEDNWIDFIDSFSENTVP